MKAQPFQKCVQSTPIGLAYPDYPLLVGDYAAGAASAAANLCFNLKKRFVS